ncbi:MAG: hypothetical protein AAF762_08335 [Pseudomonadota bacterium]
MLSAGAVSFAGGVACPQELPTGTVTALFGAPYALFHFIRLVRYG